MGIFAIEIFLWVFPFNGVTDSAVTKISDFIGDFLHQFEAIFKKALTGVSGA
jgi:hypothetical protein